jgi:hypothetical protein
MFDAIGDIDESTSIRTARQQQLVSKSGQPVTCDKPTYQILSDIAHGLLELSFAIRL